MKFCRWCTEPLAPDSAPNRIYHAGDCAKGANLEKIKLWQKRNPKAARRSAARVYEKRRRLRREATSPVLCQEDVLSLRESARAGRSGPLAVYEAPPFPERLV